MKIRPFGIAAAVLHLLSASVANAADYEATLTITPTSFQSSNAPLFHVVVRAEVDGLRMLDYKHRSDLLDNYGKMEVWREDAGFWDRLTGISDPGSISESDYIELKRSEVYSFEHRGYPFQLSDLPPGVYFAQLKLQRDWREPPVQSNTVRFEIKVP